MVELTFSSGIGLGLILGFITSLIVLNVYYRDTLRRFKTEVVAQYKYILKGFGIKRNVEGVWVMHPFDRDEIWIKKEQ